MSNRVLVFPKLADDGTLLSYVVFNIIDNLDNTYTIYIDDRDNSGAPSLAASIPATGKPVISGGSPAALAIGTPITGGTANSFLIQNGTNQFDEDAANLYYNKSNGRIGFGTNTPGLIGALDFQAGAKLHIKVGAPKFFPFILERQFTNANILFAGSGSAANAQLATVGSFDTLGAILAAADDNGVQQAAFITGRGASSAQVQGADLDIATAGKVLRVQGTQVVAAQQAAIPDAAGGVVIDVEARAALNSLLAELRTHGLIAT